MQRFVIANQHRRKGLLLAPLVPLCAFLAAPQGARAQGCVQSRGAGIGMLVQGEEIYQPGGTWQAAVGYRWLYSDRHFVGSQEQPQRQAEGSDVRNDSHFIDVTATYAITERFLLNLTIPFVTSVRTSLYEHGEVDADGKRVRHATSAAGLGDVRLSASVWLLNPETHHNGNISFGVGVKAPTGDAEVADIRYRANGPALAYVDQSIQPGDGGWGVTLETQGFQKIVKNTYAYMQMAYLINPEEKNQATGFSTPDTYLIRAGVSYSIWPAKGLSLSLGGRMEGVPVTDWIGSSEGSRRPGYSLSIEPGITWVHGKLAVTVTAPVAIDRNRERSVSDIRTGRHGDAAFADYIITSSISYRF